MSRISGLAIDRRYLHDEVAGRLKELILAGELPPRSRVNELVLCERFGISRTPLREAIKMLAAEGLLVLLPNRGARVAALDEAEIDEILEVVAGLEAVAGELAARLMTKDELAHVEALHAAMVKAWKAKDDATYFTLNREIHEAIMGAARNATLQKVYASLSGRIQTARYTAHKTPQQWKRAITEHGAMIVLLKKRDGEALAALMREHIRGKKAVISAAYAE